MSSDAAQPTEGGGTRGTAIVVGGGLAGLVAACKLAQGGVATTLLEASGRLGGRAATDIDDGFALNQGPHALYVGGPGMRELAELGVDPPRWYPVSHRSVLVRGGRARRTPGGTARLGLWIVREVMRRDPAELAGISTSEWIRSTLRTERARAAAGALVRVTTFVADHDSLSAEVAARQIKLGATSGVRYVEGGWQVIADELAERAVAAGVDLRTRAGVRAIARSASGWSLTLDDGELSADLLIVATGGPDAVRKLLGDRCPDPPGPAAEVSVLDLGLDRLPRRDRTFALGVDEPTYLSKHSPRGQDPRALLSLAGYARQGRDTLERLADVVQPGWRERVTLQRFLPRMVAVSAIATPASGGLAGRPAVDRGDGLFIAGDWVGPDGWLADAAIASGAAVARAALRMPVSSTAAEAAA